MTNKRLIGLWAASTLMTACGVGNSSKEAEAEVRGAVLGPNNCFPVSNPQAVRSAFTAALFPKSAVDVPFLCGLEGSGGCPAPFKHLDGVITAPAGAVPTRQQCKTQPGKLTVCDRYAKHLITSGLEMGNLLRLLEGVTRLSELMGRPFAPPHYALNNPQNPFVHWMASAGVAPTDLNGCASGTADDRNFCLATDPNAPHARTVRGLGALLEQHNGVLFRAGQAAGAIQRQANIFASMTGPVNVHTARTQIYMPSVGPGVQYARALAPVFGLRLLMGASADPQTELEMLANLDGYDPEGPADIFSAGFGIVSAQARAYGWDPAQQKPTAHDLQMVDDLRTFFIMLRMTARTAQALGDCLVARELAAVYSRLSQTTLAGVKLYNHPGSCPGTSPLVPHALTGLAAIAMEAIPRSFSGVGTQVIEDCNIAMTLVSVSVPEIEIEIQHETTTFTDTQCRVGASWPELDEGRVTHCECTETLETPANMECKGGSLPEDICVEYIVTVDYVVEVEVPGGEDYDSWQDYNDLNLPNGHEVEEVLETTVTQEMVESSYERLLSSDENGNGIIEIGVDEPYHHPDLADDSPDLNFTVDSAPGVDDSLHESIVNAGVNWSDCQEELVKDQETYAAAVQNGDVSCTSSSQVGADCTLNAAGLGGYGFVPYAIAQRVCPKYTAKITGVLDNQPSFGGFQVAYPTFDVSYCTTPYAFTKAVEYFLSNEPTGAALSDLSASALNSRKDVLTNFANEALLLVQPAAAMYRQRATFAAVAGDVAANAPGVDPTTWFDTHAGLQNLERELLVGEAIMSDGLHLLAGFNEVTLEASNGTVQVGTAIIADHAVSAFGACGAGCLENSENHTRARFHLVTREALETYRALSTKLLEVQWRRFGGLQCYDDDGDGGLDHCSACLSGVDTDGDSVMDALACNGFMPECVDKCAVFDSAQLITDEASQVLLDVEALLRDHDDAVGNPQISTFIARAADYALGAADELVRDHTAMLSGIDWLGFKEPSTASGASYPGVIIDPQTGILDTADAVNAAAVDIQENLNSGNAGPQISAYLANITNLTSLANSINSSLNASAQTVEFYCTGTEAACDSPWTTGLNAAGNPNGVAGYELVGNINYRIRTEICEKELTLHYHDGNDVLDLAPQPLADIAADDCPVFLSPNLNLVLPPSAQGEIPNKALQVQALLKDVEVWLNQVQREVQALEDGDYDRTALLLDQDLLIQKQKRIQAIVDGVTCGVAVVGAVVCTVATSGTCAAVVAVAGVGSYEAGSAAGVTNAAGAFGACARAFGDDLLEAAVNPSAPTQAELEQAFQTYSFEQQTQGELLNIAAHLDQLVSYASTYSYFLAEYGNLQTAFDRAISIQDDTYDNLIGSALLDPTHQMFDSDTLRDMEVQFERLARDIRKFHHLVAYDLGQPVVEGGKVSFVNGGVGNAYQLPSLNEITIVKRMGPLNLGVGNAPGSDFEGAYADLDVAGSDLSGGDLNLAAYASLLYQVWKQFEVTYDNRLTSEPHFIGSASPGIREVDVNGDGVVDANDPQYAVNVGEAAMLGISPFYDPTSYQVPGCATGEIDLRDYCTYFSDPVTHDVDPTAPVDQGGTAVCLRVSTLDEATRYSLTYLDFMVRGEDAMELFECNEGAVVCSGPQNPTDGTCPTTTLPHFITPAQGTGLSGRFSDAEVNGCAPCTDDDQLAWNVTVQSHYDVQTKTVQKIFDRYKSLDHVLIDNSSLNVDPGTYLWFVDMSPEGALHTNASFDPERSGLIVDIAGNPVVDPDTTVSEQLVAMGLICSDAHACTGATGATFDAVQVLFPGPAYLADRCVDETYQFRQERVRFDMDAQIESHAYGMKLSTGAAGFQDQVEAFLEDHRETFSPWPLHTDGLIIGLKKADWPLYRHGIGTNSGPRIRPALLYSYYGADENGSPFAATADGLLQCIAPSSCAKGHCP